MKSLFTAMFCCCLISLSAQRPTNPPLMVVDSETRFSGFGIAQPATHFHIVHADDEDDLENYPAAHIGDFPGTNFLFGYLTVNQPSDDLLLDIARFRRNGQTVLRVIGGGSVFQLDLTGDAIATGLWLDSDQKLKTDIRQLDNMLDRLRQLTPYTYSFKKELQNKRPIPKERQFGLLAQELEGVFPNLVRETRRFEEEPGGGEMVKSVNYIGLIPVVIAALQELDTKVTDKDRKIETLQATIADQQRQIDELKVMMERLLTEHNKEEANGYLLPLERKADLAQNIPNPFRETTVIRYFLPEGSGKSRLEIRSADGKLINTFPLTQSGEGQVELQAGRFPAGTYVYSLIIADEVVVSKRMVLTE
jgi:uncharacterized coiled-coil protein SlyX